MRRLRSRRIRCYGSKQSPSKGGTMRIGFVATRIAGLDDVSLEIPKLAHILREMGHESFYLAGELGAFAQPGMEVPTFHFKDPEAVALHDEAFSGVEESRTLYRR